MRFNIHGFRQDKAIEFGLNNDELLILRHFEDFATSGKMDSFYKDGHMFYWVNYDAFLKHIPILGIKKDRLGDAMIHNLGEKPIDLECQLQKCSEATAKRIRNRKYIGILKSETIRNKTVGVRSYFAFTKKFYQLKPDITSNDNEMNTHPIPISEGSHTNIGTHPIPISEGIPYQYRNKDSSIKDSSIKDSNSSSNKEDGELKEVITFYKANIARKPVLSPYEQQELLKLYGLGSELILEAMKIAIKMDKANLAYVGGIIKNWTDKGIKNSAQLTEHQQKIKNKNSYKHSIQENNGNYNSLGGNSSGKYSDNKHVIPTKTSNEEAGDDELRKIAEEIGIDICLQ